MAYHSGLHPFHLPLSLQMTSQNFANTLFDHWSHLGLTLVLPRLSCWFTAQGSASRAHPISCCLLQTSILSDYRSPGKRRKISFRVGLEPFRESDCITRSLKSSARILIKNIMADFFFSCMSTRPRHSPFDMDFFFLNRSSTVSST